MPIYEYKCCKCGTVSEVIQKFSDAPLTDCEECGNHGTLEKLMSLGSFHLKGSGWYVTDYGRKDTGGGSGSKNKTPDAPKSESAGSTESKTSTDKNSDS